MNHQINNHEKELEFLLLSKNQTLSEFENIIKEQEYKSFQEILRAHDITLNKLTEKEKELDKKLIDIEKYIEINSTCDKWDYIFAVSSGILSGFIDSFFVGSPTDSKWINNADNVINKLVQNFAKVNGWKGPNKNSDPTKSAIGFLERTFKVNYDHQYGSLVNDFMEMSASNHHLKSLSHSPSPIGLIFSLLDQFRGTATFIDNGQLITVTSDSQLQGNNLVSKIFCAFVNWLGHLMSDIAGSSGSSGRGSGIPIPFYELLQTLNIGSFDYNGEKKHFADIAVKVFEKGYDFRFGLVLSIPVLIVELFIRLFCIIRHRYQFKQEWKNCLEFLNFDQNSKLRKMLLAGQGTLCLIDAGDAFIRSEGASNWVEFFSRMNFVAWMRLSYLGLKQSVSLLQNEIEIERYKLRAKAFDEHINEVNTIADTFLEQHNRKMEKFFSERRKKLQKLFIDLEQSINDKDYIVLIDNIRQIGAQYGFKSRMGSFEELNYLIDNDEY
ncbi:hypothetical protein ACFGWO_07175 [Pasteurella multocida]|uniref:hypothetical protein n=1 Tax=Pasteurella multocida TaxID=747 RepID=UPI000DFB9283|nr:hypothetical protein [Pasteurella multocida]MCL7787273.1 hypothetical protein [Pasteurella multocida]MCL7794399.1 hypothetical protein [Pasteurella multocida]URI02483.1 hypothetical protein M8852_09305 [Pasteurella multocida]SUB45971.1 Uncharacterised protein [Pasteurella multocida subsp. septica]HDR1285737.1 hypothetical protein [Pasteurella multocida]